MANDVRIVITADDMTKAGRESAERGSKTTSEKIKTDLDGVGTKGTETGKKIRTGFEDGSKGAQEFDRILGSVVKDGETGFQTVSRSIDETKAKLSSLRTDFQTTGSRGIFGDITAAEADLKRLESYFEAMVADIPKRSKADNAGREVASGLEKGIQSVPFLGGLSMGISRFLTKFATDAAEVGEEAGKALADGMMSTADAAAKDIPQLFTPQGAIGAAILAAIVGGLAVTAGGLLASVMTVAVGGGLIAAGAVILHNNATILDSFHKLKTDIGAELKTAADPMIGPFSKALDDINAKFAGMGPQLHDLFASVAPAVGPVLTGLADFIAYLVPRLTMVGHVFSEMFNDPSVQESLSALGASIGLLFTIIGSNKQTVIDFFRLLLALVGTAVLAIDALVVSAQILDGVFHSLTGNFGYLENLGTKTKSAAVGVGALTDATGNAVPNFDAYIAKLNTITNTVDTTAGAITDKLIGGMLNSDIAANDFDKSLVTLGDTLAKNGGHLTAHVSALKKSESGAMQNKDAILAVVQANLRMYDSQIQAGISSADAADQYDRNTKALEAQMRAGGMTSAQIQALIGKYEKVPDEVNTDLAINGLTEAINNLDDLERALAGLPAMKYVTIEEIHRESNVTGGGNPPPKQRVSTPVKHAKKATGGILGSEPSTYGEEGWELLKMPGAMVSSHADSVSRAGQSSSGPAVIEVHLIGDDSATAAFLRTVRAKVRHLGAEATLGVSAKSLGLATGR